MLRALSPFRPCAACEPVSVNLEPVVWGTRYPTPDLMCELFRLGCESSVEFDTAVTWLVKTLEGNPDWTVEDMAALLFRGLQVAYSLKNC